MQVDVGVHMKNSRSMAQGVREREDLQPKVNMTSQLPSPSDPISFPPPGSTTRGAINDIFRVNGKHPAQVVTLCQNEEQAFQEPPQLSSIVRLLLIGRNKVTKIQGGPK